LFHHYHLSMSNSTTASPLSGRRAEAARNDERILASARAVFVADPGAPIAAVAKHAGVGISALYNRYGSKEELLRVICMDGLQRFVVEVEAALADDRDPWTVFAEFLQRAVDADTNSLTVALAGTFTPTEDMFREGERANRLLAELFERTRKAGVLRPDLEVHDLSKLFELMAAVRGVDEQRTRELRRRYLALLLDSVHSPAATTTLPGPAPTREEINTRWMK
jgi:AcrR family transcriptional regulator